MAAWALDLSGCSVGPFQLDMDFFEALLRIKSCSYLGTCRISFCEESPFAAPLVLLLEQEGIRLEFDSASQMLIRIVLSNLRSVSLSYQGTIISGPRCETTLDVIYSVLPRTVLGRLDREGGIYELPYSSASFLFKIPTEYQDLYEGMNFAVCTPDGESPQCVGIVMKVGEDKNTQLKRPGRGVIIEGERGLYLGDSVQSCVSLLGAPDRHYFPQGTQQKIHQSEQHNEEDKQQTSLPLHVVIPTKKEHSCGVEVLKEACRERNNSPDFYYNYFRLGLDLLFDETLALKRIVAHTSIPGHADFGCYRKCAFYAEIGDKTVTDLSIREELASFGGGALPAPVVSARSRGSQNQETTFFFGFQSGIAFEVTPTEHIASVMLFT